MSNNDIEAAQQYMLELLYSQASDHLSSGHFQQQHDMAEATDSEESVQQLVESSEATDSDESATTSRVPFVRSHVERTLDPRSPHPSQHQVEDEVIIIDTEEIIQDCGDGLLSPKCCIYRVHTSLRHLKEEAYTPQVVSIGPFHHCNVKLENMERHKQILFERFAQRTASSWHDWVSFVKHLVPKVRDSYSETINLTQQRLVKLILMDAIFIIELFIFKRTSEPRNDAKFSQQGLEISILEDLILIENQLPFFVIEELFNKAFPHGWSGDSFLELAYVAFGHFNKQKLKPNADMKIKHFTDLLRLFYLQEEMPQQDDLHEEMPQWDESSTGEGSHILKFNASELQEAGIKLKNSKSKCLLDLELSENILEIPQILVEDGTEVVFRNMIALEQCLYPNDARITNYAIIMDRLIDASKDVDLLVNKKILLHYFGDSHNVALFFNGLCKNVVETNFIPKYVAICKRLNGYCENPWHKKKATLRRDYCNTPWRTVASIAGIILLIFTIVQTIFSVLPVVLK